MIGNWYAGRDIRGKSQLWGMPAVPSSFHTGCFFYWFRPNSSKYGTVPYLELFGPNQSKKTPSISPHFLRGVHKRFASAYSL